MYNQRIRIAHSTEVVDILFTPVDKKPTGSQHRELINLFYGHYTGQPALASTPS